jgi:hypothetical protein
MTTSPVFGAKHMTRIYPVNSKDSHPGPLFLCRSSVKPSPRRPLIPMRHTPSELTGTATMKHPTL